MVAERTLSFIKPDTVEKNVIGWIYTRIEMPCEVIKICFQASAINPRATCRSKTSNCLGQLFIERDLNLVPATSNTGANKYRNRSTQVLTLI